MNRLSILFKMAKAELQSALAEGTASLSAALRWFWYWLTRTQKYCFLMLRTTRPSRIAFVQRVNGLH